MKNSITKKLLTILSILFVSLFFEMNEAGTDLVDDLIKKHNPDPKNNHRRFLFRLNSFSEMAPKYDKI